MTDTASISFSFDALAHLQVVCDNARSHAPFHDPYLIALQSASEASSCASELEQAEDAAFGGGEPQCISPARGLTRWGSQQDLISNTGPKPPSRSTAADSPISWCYEGPTLLPLPLPPPPCPNIISSSPLETRIHRIRSRWNSHSSGCYDKDLNDDNDHIRDGKAIGKISLSPTLPRRLVDCPEEIKLPRFSDSLGYHAAGDSKDWLPCVPATRSEGSLLKTVLHQLKTTQRLEDISKVPPLAAAAVAVPEDSAGGQWKWREAASGG
jgi:hypothetical protein